MIKVAHLLPTMQIGGRERIVADLCRAAAGLGVDPVIVTYDQPEAACALIQTPILPTYSLDRRDPGFRQDLGMVLAREGVDVLHAQGHVSAALAAGATGGVPMLATMHMALGSGWRWLVPVVRGLRTADQLTAVSEDLAQRYRRLSGRPVDVIPTGVDLARFSPELAEHDPARPFTIGIAARLHPVKRLEDAIAAMRILAGRNVRCRLVIAGEGPLRADLDGRAHGLPVELLGAVEDMPEFLRGLDAFLLPSDHEGTPAVLLEAMATGLPCIATRVGGIPELLGDSGLLVPRRDPVAIADAIERLVGDPALCELLGTAAAERARSYALDHQARAYAGKYWQMAEKDRDVTA